MICFLTSLAPYKIRSSLLVDCVLVVEIVLSLDSCVTSLTVVIFTVYTTPGVSSDISSVVVVLSMLGTSPESGDQLTLYLLMSSVSDGAVQLTVKPFVWTLLKLIADTARLLTEIYKIFAISVDKNTSAFKTRKCVYETLCPEPHA